MKYILRKARQGEEAAVYSMIADRVKWMDRNGIHQWNDTEYLEIYPLAYYRRNLDRLYVLTEESAERIACAAILFAQDDRWEASENSLYIHNFVSALDSPGAGTHFMQMLEELAKKEGISYLRLDSAIDNVKLASYYEKLGFEPCGECLDGSYHGVLRQKKVQ